MKRGLVYFITPVILGALIAFSQPWENTEYVAYPDIGDVWTICDGVTYINGQRVREGQTATPKECAKLTEAAHIEAGSAVLRLTRPLPLETFNAVEDFVYNVGAENYRKSTLRFLLNQNEIFLACQEFPKWKFAAKKDCTLKENKCGGIPKRREAERTQCLKGVQ